MTKTNRTEILGVALTGYTKAYKEMTFGEKFYNSCAVHIYVSPSPRGNNAHIVLEYGSRPTVVYDYGTEYEMVDNDYKVD